MANEHSNKHSHKHSHDSSKSKRRNVGTGISKSSAETKTKNKLKRTLGDEHEHDTDTDNSLYKNPNSNSNSNHAEKKKSKMVAKKPRLSDTLKHEENAEDNDFDDDDENNYSQDSFLEWHFESIEDKKPVIQKATDMPPTISNYLWRALNSAQPHNGFGFLTHMESAFNVVPNYNLASNFSQFILTGPKSEGTRFKDYHRTELTELYIESITKKLMEPGCEGKSRIGPSKWIELEQILSLPLTETKDIIITPNKSHSTFKIQQLAQALQFSSTSLRIISSAFKLELEEAISTDNIFESRPLYCNQPLTTLFMKNQIRGSLKAVIRLAVQCWIQHGHWLLGYLNEDRRVCETSEEQHCASEVKSCLASMGSIICHLAWLNCAEEGVEFGSENCCYDIRDAVLLELESLDFTKYNSSGKKVSAAAKKKFLRSFKLRILLSLTTDFSRPLQSKLAGLFELSAAEVSLLL